MALPKVEERQVGSGLAALKSNLEENLVILEKMTEFNKETIESLETVLEYIETKRPYSDSLASHLGIIDNWSSPYLTSSAYVTLKSRGVGDHCGQQVTESDCQTF